MPRDIELGKKGRIAALVDMAGAADFAIEVGCDHGLISCGLAERDDIKRILATDISVASISKLKNFLKDQEFSGENPYSRKISCLVNDGLKGLNFEACDLIVIAGMGGRLIQRIMEGNIDLVKKTGQVLVGPQSDLPMFRKFLISLGWCISEEMVYDSGHYYTILDLNPAKKINEAYVDMSERKLALKYGPDLLLKKNPVLKEKLEKDFSSTGLLIDKLERELKEKDTKNISDRIGLLSEDRKDIGVLLSLYDWPSKE